MAPTLGRETRVINRRNFLYGAASATALAGAANNPLLHAATAPSKRPNIILMLVDDLGYGDFGCNGNTFHETPNIDALCREGVKFTNAYAMAPVCSPSRCGIMTGQHPARVHLTQYIPGVIYPHKKLIEPKALMHLPANIPTLASELKKLGYYTGSIGKWHLGGEGFLPENFGFDFNVAGDYHGRPVPPHDYFGPFHYHNLEGYTEKDNLTEVLSTKADTFLEQAATRGPFFLYFAEFAVHIPISERPERVAKYMRKNHSDSDYSEPDPVYAAVVESVDTALGKLRKKLHELHLAENTVILLTSDNGGLGFQGRELHRIADNGPLRGGKGYTYEGGIREPLIAYWPGITHAGTVCDVPVWGCDFMPTFLSMAGGAAPAITDGVDLSPLLRDGAAPSRDTLYWHYPHYSDQGGVPSGVIREGDWKLIEFFEDGHLELYNLKVDEGERYNLASTYFDKAFELHKKLVAWRTSLHADMPTPNPNFDPANAGEHPSPLGCSVTSHHDCQED